MSTPCLADRLWREELSWRAGCAMLSCLHNTPACAWGACEARQGRLVTLSHESSGIVTCSCHCHMECLEPHRVSGAE